MKVCFFSAFSFSQIFVSDNIVIVCVYRIDKIYIKRSHQKNRNTHDLLRLTTIEVSLACIYSMLRRTDTKTILC